MTRTVLINLCLSDGAISYIDDDEKKSMAIVNLQAMLGLEDVDQVISMLEKNNWDETVSTQWHIKIDRQQLMSTLQDWYSQDQEAQLSLHNRHLGSRIMCVHPSSINKV